MAIRCSTRPADLQFNETLKKVPKKLRLGLFFDQTSEACDWHLPLAHFLESWGDTEATDGSLCCVQPLIAPLNSGKTAGETQSARGGRTFIEVMTRLTQIGVDGKPLTSFDVAQKAAYDFVRKAFSERSGIALTAPEFDIEFNRYKQLGFLPLDKDKKVRATKSVSLNAANVAKELLRFQSTPAPTKDAVEVTFHASYSLHDGRGAMNPCCKNCPTRSRNSCGTTPR